MAKPTTQKWTALSVWPGDGGNPEDFTSMACGFTSKSFDLAGTTADVVVPDCDDPDDAAWTERIIRSLSAGFTASGIMAEETYSTWRTWMLSGDAKNARIVLSLTAPGYYQGSFVLTRLETTGNQADAKVQVNISMESDGPVTWTTGAP